jgi:hypothetical protein
MKHIKLFEKFDKFDSIYYLKNEIYQELYQFDIYNKLIKMSESNITMSDIRRLDNILKDLITLSNYDININKNNYKLTYNDPDFDSSYVISKIQDDYWLIMSESYVYIELDSDSLNGGQLDARYFICDGMDGIKTCFSDNWKD